MNRTEYIGKLNALYVGEKNCLEELITIYDEKDKEIERLNNIIKEVKEYIESYMPNYDFDKTNLIKLLGILKGSDKE